MGWGGGGGLIQLGRGPSNPIKRRGIRAGGAPSCSIKQWSTLLKHTRDGTHWHRYTHPPLTPLIAQEPPLMDASKWNCQIIHCLNALASPSFSSPTLSFPGFPHTLLTPLSICSHLTLAPQPPPGSPAQEEHLRNQKCRHPRNTCSRRPQLEGARAGRGERGREEGKRLQRFRRSSIRLDVGYFTKRCGGTGRLDSQQQVIRGKAL